LGRRIVGLEISCGFIQKVGLGLLLALLAGVFFSCSGTIVLKSGQKWFFNFQFDLDFLELKLGGKLTELPPTKSSSAYSEFNSRSGQVPRHRVSGKSSVKQVLLVILSPFSI
jgi:hypothetical protein